MLADRKNVRSTKSKPADMTTDASSNSVGPPVRANEFYTKVVNLSGKEHSDQTYRFPATSSKGNKHVMIACDYDCNAILAYPLKSKNLSDHLEAVKTIQQFINSKGSHLKLHMLDNECSKIVRNFIKKEINIEILLDLPCLHRTHAAEKSIDTRKNHPIDGLSSVEPSFTLRLWRMLLPLETTTLSLMRTSRINPKLSAHELLSGIFDCNKTPLARQIARSWCMKIATNVARGIHMESQVGALDPQATIADVTECVPLKPNRSGMLKQFVSFRIK